MKKFAIVIDIPEPNRSIILKAQNKLLEKFNIRNIIEKSAGPHITLIQGLKSKEDAENLINRQKPSAPYQVEFNSLGVLFLSHPLLFYRWWLSRDIGNLVSSMLKDANTLKIPFEPLNLNFLAKSTIAFGDTKKEDVSEYLEILNDYSSLESFELSSLSIFSYDNCEKRVSNITLTQY